MTREHRAWEMLIRRLNYLNTFGGNRSEMEKTTRIVAEIWDDAGHEEGAGVKVGTMVDDPALEAKGVKDKDGKTPQIRKGELLRRERNISFHSFRHPLLCHSSSREWVFRKKRKDHDEVRCQ